MEKQVLIDRLKEIVGPDYALFSDMDLTLYGYDASLEKGRPDAVVLPASAEECLPGGRLGVQGEDPGDRPGARART